MCLRCFVMEVRAGLRKILLILSEALFYVTE